MKTSIARHLKDGPPITRYGAIGIFAVLISINTSALPSQESISSSWIQHGSGSGMGWGGMLFGPLVWILIAVFIIALVMFAVRRTDNSSSGSGPQQSEKSPQDILKERYANGEIDKEEFEERRRVLKD